MIIPLTLDTDVRVLVKITKPSDQYNDNDEYLLDVRFVPMMMLLVNDQCMTLLGTHTLREVTHDLRRNIIRQ